MITIPYHIHAVDRVARRADDQRPDVDASTSTSRDPSAGNLNFERDVGWRLKYKARGQQIGLVPQPLVQITRALRTWNDR
jgi:hypothetical protein